MSDNETKGREVEIAIQVIKANINAHGLDIWKLRDAEKILLEAYDALQKQLEVEKKLYQACRKSFDDVVKQLDEAKAEWERISTFSREEAARLFDANNRVHELEAENTRLREALKKAEKRFSHIEDWHRDNVTPDNFEDCQEVGQTPEAYLRDGKNECREALKKEGGNNG